MAEPEEALVLEWMDGGKNEESLVPPRHRLRRRRPGSQDGEEVSRLVSGAQFHLLEGMGLGSW